MAKVVTVITITQEVGEATAYDLERYAGQVFDYMCADIEETDGIIVDVYKEDE